MTNPGPVNCHRWSEYIGMWEVRWWNMNSENNWVGVEGWHFCPTCGIGLGPDGREYAQVPWARAEQAEKRCLEYRVAAERYRCLIKANVKVVCPQMAPAIIIGFSWDGEKIETLASELAGLETEERFSRPTRFCSVCDKAENDGALMGSPEPWTCPECRAKEASHD